MENTLSLIAELFKDVPWPYIGLGIGTVFFGLICIVLLCKIIGLFCKGSAKREDKVEQKTPATLVGKERQQIIAAVVAACAEEMGKDVKALRVVSFKKI